MTAIPLRLLFVSLFVTVSASVFAQPLLSFGSPGRAAGAFRAAGEVPESISVTDTEFSLRIRSPNYWSLHAQATTLYADYADADMADYFAIEVRGTITDESPVLRIVLISDDWSSKSEWTFNLSGINPDSYTTIRATEPIATPKPVDETPPLNLSAPVNNAQILAFASVGNRPWHLEIRSLQVTKP